MKRILFSLLALVGMTLTASAVEPAFKIKVGTNEHGTFAFKVNDVVATPDGSGAVAADEGDKITLTITADDDWTVGTPSGNWSAAVAKTRVTNNETIDMLENVDLEFVSTDQTTGAVTYKFDMERADAVISCTYKKMMSHEDITIGEIDVQTYTGSGLTPAVVVKDGANTLTLWNEQTQTGDYKVAYTDNVNVGTATVTITGAGDNYDGQATTTFDIKAADSKVVFNTYPVTKTYGDEDFTIEPTVTGDGTLVYWSTDESVATVNSSSGKVHIVGTGEVRIYAALTDDPNYNSSSDWYVLTVSPKQTTVTIGATGMITYCGTEALDFTGNEDLEAYTVIGCSYGSNTIWMSRVYNVPAETPIVIKAAKEGTYELNIATSTDSYYLNRLVGNLSGSTIQVNETSEDGTVRNYYLKSGEFKKVSNYANIANGKAYLQMPASVADEKAGSAVDITLSSTGKSTLCSDVDLDFSGVEGLKAYVVTGYDMPTKTFWLNRVVEASAGTPLYLAGKANTTYSIPSKGVKTSFENMLVGNLSGSTIQVEEESEDGALRNLYLKEGTFKKVNNYVNIYNGKCYLQAPSDIVAAMARGMEDPDFNLVLNDELMSIGFSDIDDEATGIVPIENGPWTMDNSAGAWYDLQGRKLQGRPTRSGVYVNNGRKVVLK